MSDPIDPYQSYREQRYRGSSEPGAPGQPYQHGPYQQGPYKQAPQQGPYRPGAYGLPPSNHLAWAILSTIFCCLPLGIVSIVYAAQVNTQWRAGDAAGAQASADSAKNWAMASAGLMIAFYALALAGGAASSR